MAANRIHVIGATGSGTSTLGRKLASVLSIAHFDSDDYFHAFTDPPFQRPRPGEERNELICRDLRPDASWVLSGGIVNWLPCPVLNFTCIVFLYVPAEVRVERLQFRERARFGNRIEEGGDMYESHQNFMEWAAHYDRGDVEGSTLAVHEAYLHNQPCHVLEYRGMMPVAKIADDVLQTIIPAGECHKTRR